MLLFPGFLLLNLNFMFMNIGRCVKLLNIVYKVNKNKKIKSFSKQAIRVSFIGNSPYKISYIFNIKCKHFILKTL